jgi:two-component system CAI-1 autoinducer sensor kinase/phosphatase CqsS
MIIALCLALFRKRDVDLHKSVSSKLVHEASRSLSSLSTSAQFLKLKLPELLNSYEWASKNGYSTIAINHEVIEELMSLPNQLQNMGKRTTNTLDTLFGKIYPHQEVENTCTTINILDCIKEAMAEPVFNDRRNNHLKISFDNDFCLLGNQSQITQAILNLIENAFFAIQNKDNGQIEIWIDDYSVFVRDNGMGISSNNLPNIFDEFFSTKKTLGQGLAFCRQVMLEHGGSISCKSEENNFTEFELRFPGAGLKTC